MFLADTPDTFVYMVAGFAVIFGVMGLHLLSLWVRRRNLMRDLMLLEELKDK
ncbi:MAG: hypothetical protein PVF49_11010 [Anaerolineales bacterium]|jgi:hypothetical protein